MILTALIILLLALTIASAYFSLSQIALFSISSNELKLYHESKDKRKQLIAKLLSKPRDLLVTILFCDIAANIFIQNTAANIFGEFSTWFLKVGVPLIVTLLLGEIFPKTIALPYNTKIAYAVAPSIMKIQNLLGPIRKWMNSVTTHISRVLFFFLKKEQEISKEELNHVLKSSEHYGILTRHEAELVEGYLSLTDYTVKERMQPRHEILYYNTEDSISKLIHLFLEKECSRIPVCRGDLQNMLGICLARDFFIHQKEIITTAHLLPFLKKPYYVPETIDARTLLHQFMQLKETMGIVVDEYGSICGLITEEDLQEVVVGEIADIRDRKSRYTLAGKDVIITSGKFELTEFEELFHVPLHSENNCVTLGGWLTEQLGEIPKSGTKFQWDGFLFQVLAADPNRIRRIYIRRIKKE